MLQNRLVVGSHTSGVRSECGGRGRAKETQRVDGLFRFNLSGLVFDDFLHRKTMAFFSLGRPRPLTLHQPPSAFFPPSFGPSRSIFHVSQPRVHFLPLCPIPGNFLRSISQLTNSHLSTLLFNIPTGFFRLLAIVSILEIPFGSLLDWSTRTLSWVLCSDAGTRVSQLAGSPGCGYLPRGLSS